MNKKIIEQMNLEKLTPLSGDQLLVIVGGSLFLEENTVSFSNGDCLCFNTNKGNCKIHKKKPTTTTTTTSKLVK